MWYRLVSSIVLGILAYVWLGFFPYFMDWWRAFFGLIIALTALRFFKTAVFLTIITIGISIAYHSFDLFLVYIFTAFVFTLAILPSAYFSEIFLLISMTPLLAKINFAGSPLPMEFLTIFLAAIFLRGRKVSLVAGLACLWCCLVGIVTRSEFMGNLIVGAPLYNFFTPQATTPVASFYDFSWFSQRIADFSKTGFSVPLRIATDVFNHLLGYPQIILQALAWSTISYVASIFLNKNKWWWNVGVYALILFSLIVLQAVVVALYPGIETFDLSRFGVVVSLVMLVALIVYELLSLVFKREPDAVAITTEIGAAGPIPSSQLFGTASGNTMQNMTLEETLKMQKQLQEYIKRKFSQELTSLDIDVVDSGKMKQNESAEEVLFAFAEYWKLIDRLMLRKKGKLLNRFGDGAIYLFEDVEMAIGAAREVTNNLELFNSNVNTLKTKFHVRIGMNTGEVVSDPSKNTGDVFSRVLDIAGHLQKMAKPGNILVSEYTYTRIRNKLDFVPAGASEKDHINVYLYQPKR